MDAAETQIETGIASAIRIAGGARALANQLGETPQTVCNWRARGAAPANRCPEIERITGVCRQQLRPDDWSDYWPELIGPVCASAEARAGG
jgi:DNA-binding transcriptional regulator YdaS (Cro superfamily)